MKRPKMGKKLAQQAKKLLLDLEELVDTEAALRKFLAEEQDPQYDFLITLYPGLKNGADQSQVVLRRYRDVTKRAIRDLKPAFNPLVWLFASGEEKRRAYASCNYLTDSLAIGLTEQYDRAVSCISACFKSKPDLRKAYEQDPAAYHKLLLELRTEAEKQ